ncbi:MAG: DedA family protein [Myxococcales bacterium]|nr:DedA family protein [Myxococcales bacterium]MCB9581893.1 DedA family protein [Polyangiaceae bacterium]
MTDALIQYIETAAAHAPTWGFLLILLFMAVESSFIPFPSEVVMIPAGFLAARGELTLGSPMGDAAVAVLAGVGGSLVGAFVNYYLFSWLGTPFLEKYGKYFLLPKAKLERAEEVFRKYGAGATFVCRLLPAIRQLISIPAGISRMPIKSFSLWTGLGAGIWVTILTGIGFYLGKSTAAMSYADLVHQGKAMVKHDLIYIIPACLVVFVVYVLVSNKIMKKSEPAKA